MLKGFASAADVDDKRRQKVDDGYRQHQTSCRRQRL